MKNCKYEPCGYLATCPSSFIRSNWKKDLFSQQLVCVLYWIYNEAVVYFAVIFSPTCKEYPCAWLPFIHCTFTTPSAFFLQFSPNLQCNTKSTARKTLFFSSTGLTITRGLDKKSKIGEIHTYIYTTSRRKNNQEIRNTKESFGPS
jgi:hypothetical protein